MPETLTPELRRLRALNAIHTRWANTPDRTAATKPGRDAFMARFEREVDPDGTLDPKERAIRAEHAKRAYFARLSYEAAKARRAKKKAGR